MQRTHVVFPALATLIGASLLAGCPSRDVSRVDPRQTNEQVKDIPINLSRDIDILFVIDNSVSMGEEQASLRANFPAFIDVLENIEGGLPSVHIAVVSSDVGIGSNSQGSCSGSGDDGDFRLGWDGSQKDTCTDISGNARYIAAGAGTTPNVADLEAAFSCIAGLGDRGCGFEGHLESMKRGLSKAKEGTAPNDGFLREDAYLAVIFIADEDDCSATPSGADTMFDTSSGQDSATSMLGFLNSFRCWEFGVVCNDDSPGPRIMDEDGTPSARQNCVPRDDSPYMAKVSDYVDFLKGLKADPSRVLVAGIIGPPDPVRVHRESRDNDPAVEFELMPSCENPGRAAPATRLKAFLDAFPNRSVQQTICADDLSGGLTQIAELLARVVGTPCLEGQLVDTDPATDGIQPDCRVSDFQYKGFANETETSMKSCDAAGSERPCYNLIDGGAQCAANPTGLAIEIVRDGAPPPETTVGVRCLAE
jgi:hypothetical protein